MSEQVHRSKYQKKKERRLQKKGKRNSHDVKRSVQAVTKENKTSVVTSETSPALNDHVKFEIHVIGPNSEGKTNLLNWLSGSPEHSSSDIPLVTSQFSSSQWSSEYYEVKQQQFVSCYVNSLIDNAVSILSNGTVNKVTDNISRLTNHTIFTAFIWNMIGYSECRALMRFLSAKPVTIVTFDVPQQQQELSLATSEELCRVLENIESAEEYGSPLIAIMVGIHNGVNSTILDQCRNNILDYINAKSYSKCRQLLAVNPKHAVMFFDCQCEDSCEVKQLIVDRVEEFHGGAPTQLLSTDHCNMLQNVSDNAIVVMDKKQFSCTILPQSKRSIEQLSGDGVVYHFDQCPPSLQEVIFTSPHWLNNMIVLLTSPVGWATIRLSVDSKCCCNGIISVQVLDQLLQSYNTSTVKLTQVMMSLLVHLNLAVPLSSDVIGEAILVSSDEATALLIPSLISNDSSVVTTTLTDYTIILFSTTTTTGLVSYSTTQLLVNLLTWGFNKGHHLISVNASGAVFQMMNNDHCYHLNIITSSEIMLHLPQPRPPMSPEAIQQSVDHQTQLVELSQQWWREIVGGEAVSGVLCPLCKNQPHPLDHLQCKGQSVVLSEHTKLLMTSGTVTQDVSMATAAERSCNVKKFSNIADSGSHDAQPSGVQCHHQHHMMKLQMMERKLNSLDIITCKECSSDDVSVCLKCAQLYCKDHVMQHCSTVKKHYIIIKLSKMEIMCSQCGVVTDPHPVMKRCLSYLDNWYKSCDPVTSMLTTGHQTSLQHTASVTIPDDIPIKGLPNIGNTCYFNSAIQNIIHAPGIANQITGVFTSRSLVLHAPSSLKVDPLNVTMTTSPGAMTTSLIQLMKQISAHNSNVSTGPLLKQICKRYKHFDGHRQQDSHELIRYLLDGMKTEEVERIKRAILTAYGVAGDAKGVKLTNHDRMAIKAFGRCAENVSTFVDDVFAGTLVSSVICHQCHTASQMIEKFLDLSLPISYKESQQHKGGKGSHQRSRKSEEVTSHGKKSKRDKQREKQAKKKAKGKGSKHKKQVPSNAHPTQSDDDSEDEATDELKSPANNDQPLMTSSMTTQPSLGDSLYDLEYVRHHLESNGLHYQPVNPSHGSHDLFSLEACLTAYTSLDILCDDNQFLCEHCNKSQSCHDNKVTDAVFDGNHDSQSGPMGDDSDGTHSDNDDAAAILSDATKQLLIHHPPKILLLQLKRFNYFNYRSSRKNNTHIIFPMLLDLAPYCSDACQAMRCSSGQLLYALYGMVVHSGTMDHGHYVAYIRDGKYSDKAKWYCVNDSHVSSVSIETVLNNQAYILFYELLN